MNRLIVAAGAALLAAGCSGEAPENKVEAAPAELDAGQYQASWTINQLRSTDRTIPATNLKEKATGTTLACVGPKNEFDFALFAEDGDTCTPSNSYARNGRMSIELNCKRKGAEGEIRSSISGTYTANGFEAEVSTATYLAAPGDYALIRTVTGKRVGEGPPAADSASDAKAAS